MPDPNLSPDLIAAYNAEPALPCEGPVINGLELRKKLGPKRWGIAEEFGCCGWAIRNKLGNLNILVTGDHQSDSVQWVHASISRRLEMPTYDQLKVLHAAVFGDGWAYQVFAPPAEHVNIHANALHLFGRLDGERVLPDFGRYGTI